VVEWNDISCVLRRRGALEICGKSSEETLEILQNAYGTEAMCRATVFRWWRHFKDGNEGWLVALEVGDQALLSQM
jgi:hypothetical protein